LWPTRCDAGGLQRARSTRLRRIRSRHECLRAWRPSGACGTVVGGYYRTRNIMLIIMNLMNVARVLIPLRMQRNVKGMARKLYTHDLSPYAGRVRMQIYAKGLTDIVFEQPGDDWGLPTFREKFPIGRIPVLDADGELIPESEVIAEYLEEIYPKPSLLG